MKVVCFGDSNTYGYDPRSFLGGRYDPSGRWVDLLAAGTGRTVLNQGENGLEIPAAVPDFPEDTDLLILMLGTNDLLSGRGPQQAAERLRRFLCNLPLPAEKILLIAPPLALGEWVQSRQLIDESTAFAGYCRIIAHQLGIRFADAGSWDVTPAFDGVHFTASGHRAFAAGLLALLQNPNC